MITNPNTLNVRIKHKYDSYSAWTTNNPVLERGEIAVVEIPTNPTPDFTNEPEGSSRLTPPAIGVKIGDGTKRFKELPWIQSTAGDVYAWAKKETLEFEDISEDFIEKFQGALIQDSNTKYVFEYANDELVIKSYEKGQEDNPELYQEVKKITISDSTKISKVASATAGNLPALTEDGSLTDSGEKIGDFLKTATAEATYATLEDFDLHLEAFSDLTDRVTALDSEEGRVAKVEAAIDVLNGEATVEGSVKKQVVDAIAGVVAKAPEDFDTLKEIADWIANDQTGAANLANRLSALDAEGTGRVPVLESDVADLQELLSGDGIVHSHANKDVLDGITAEKVSAWDAAEQNAKDYADGLNNAQTGAVNAVSDRVTTLEDVVGKTENDGLQAAVAALEDIAHTHTNKDTLDDITDEKVAAWDAAIQAGNGVSVTTADGKQVVSSVSTDLLTTGTKTLVIECGTSAI